MSVWFPMLPIDVLRRADRRRGAPRDTRPVLLIARDGQRQVVASCCAKAASRGVAPGMPAGEAGALIASDHVRVEPADPGRDLAALRALSVWAHRFSPVVSLDEPDGLFLDITGCARVFRGEDRLLDRCARAADALGLATRIAAAPTFTAAGALARYTDRTVTIVTEGTLRESLSPLSIAALKLEGDAEAALIEIGVERIGQLLALPARALPSRFGQHIVLTLDRALGSAIEVLEPVRPTEPLRVQRVFSGPTANWEAIEITARALLDELVILLRSRESGARLLELELTRADLEPARLRISMARPTRDARHLWSLLRPRLERANMGFGVEGVSLAAPWTGRLRHEQADIWKENDAFLAAETERFQSELVDTLAARLGPAAPLRAELFASYIPERAFRLRADADFAPPDVPLPDRPSLLFDSPEPAQVISLTPDGPVHAARWKGGEHRAASCTGPERIGGEWWRADRSSRDYFALRDQRGVRLWIFRENATGRWFVHGVWA